MNEQFYKYTGDGTSFISGVPTRDLSEQEFKALPVEQREECLNSGLYKASAKAAAPKFAPEPVKEAENG